jgi:hypothetical protein
MMVYMLSIALCDQDPDDMGFRFSLSVLADDVSVLLKEESQEEE